VTGTDSAKAKEAILLAKSQTNEIPPNARVHFSFQHVQSV
jgi:hypothetical protein